MPALYFNNHFIILPQFHAFIPYLYRNTVANCQFLLHCALAAAQCIVIAPICVFVCGSVTTIPSGVWGGDPAEIEFGAF